MTFDRSRAFSAPRKSRYITLEIGQHIAGTLGDKITELDPFKKDGTTRSRYWFTPHGQSDAKLLPPSEQLTDSVDAFVKANGPRARCVIERWPNEGRSHVYGVYAADVLGLPSGGNAGLAQQTSLAPTPPPQTLRTSPRANGGAADGVLNSDGEPVPF